MPAQWTAEIVGQMHLNGISAKTLAEAIGWHPKYLSSVLHGHKCPRDAESKVRSALNGLLHCNSNEEDKPCCHP